MSFFNHEQYYKDHEALKNELQKGEDQSWKKGIELRYAQFLMRKVANQLQFHQNALTQPAPDKEELRKAIAQGIAGAAGELSFAAALMSQNCSVRDMAEAEATMRLFAIAATPPK
jgi:hypothetical protein